MKNLSSNKELSSSDEISSIIYSMLATASSSKHLSKRPDFDVVEFVIESMYDLEFPIYKHLEFITRDGGARYVMNDVSSYRTSKDIEAKTLHTLKRLFTKYGCKTKADVVNFIKGICENPDINLYSFDEIKKALMAYEVYYKNGIIISQWPSEEKLINDYEKSKKNNQNDDFIDNFIDIARSNDTVAYSAKSVKYPNSQMLLVAKGIDDVNTESAAYMFYEYMNEWYFNINPYDENFEEELLSYFNVLNNQIVNYLKEKNTTSTAAVSVVIINEDKTYICSIGDTRVYTIKENKLNRIMRKETGLDDVWANSIISMPVDLALSVPSGYIGLDKYNVPKCNVDLEILDSSKLEGILVMTPDAYRGMPQEDLETYVNTFDETELLNMISMYKEPNKTNGYALYKKRK